MPQRIVLSSVLGVFISISLLAENSRHPSAPAAAAGAQAGTNSQPTLWIVPHTHWEGAVFKTREEYLESGLPNILKALYLLRTYPEYRFVLDQVAYIRPFLERYPEEVPEFRKFVAEGRLQIVGANDVMLDVNIPSGESWIRQVQYGKGYCKRELGLDVNVGWALDTFGHHAQMPQLLKLAGYNSYWFQRGVQGNDVPSESMWEGIDGSRIPAFWLPWGYGMFYPSPANASQFSQYAQGVWMSFDHYSRWPDRVVLAGADVIEPEDALPAMVREFNRQSGEPFALRFGVPTDFESIVARRSERPVIKGDLNPVFQGIYSNRIEVKQWMRNLERILTTAEKLGALGKWLGLAATNQNLERAWEPVLFNQAHDLASGTMVDKVYQDTMRGYEFSKSLGDEMVETDLDAIGSKVDTSAEGIPVLVFNSLGWLRTDVANVKIGFSEPAVTSVRLLDSSGQPVPAQLVEAERYPDGGIKDARVFFVARDVHALGYSLYRILPQKQPHSANSVARQTASSAGQESASTMHEDVGSIENEYYRATFDLWTGALTKLLVRSPSGEWNAIGDQAANVVAEEQDGGDFWELYGTLNGGRLTAMTTKQGLPVAGRFHLSNEWVGGDGKTEPGPVFSEFRISHPFGAGSFATTVRLYRGVPRLDIQTELVNNDKSVRYRMLFPTSIGKGSRFDEIPFGAIERPKDQEFPAQNWIDWSDGARGVALLNRGLPGNNVASGTLILSLLRSARITAYPFFGGYEAGVSSDLGLELGEKRVFDYAIVPHAGDFRSAGVYRSGLEFNNPLVARPLARHSGSLPPRWGLLEVSPSNVVTSALSEGQNGNLILRVYEAGGQKTDGVKIKIQPGIASVDEVNLVGDRVRKADFQDNNLSFELGASEIRTFELKLKGSKDAR